MLYQEQTKLVRSIIITGVKTDDDSAFKKAFKADLNEMFASTYYAMFEKEIKFHMYFTVSVEVKPNTDAKRIADLIKDTFGEFTERFAEVGTMRYRGWTHASGSLWIDADIMCVREWNNG